MRARQRAGLAAEAVAFRFRGLACIRASSFSRSRTGRLTLTEHLCVCALACRARAAPFPRARCEQRGPGALGDAGEPLRPFGLVCVRTRACTRVCAGASAQHRSGLTISLRSGCGPHGVRARAASESSALRGQLQLCPRRQRKRKLGCGRWRWRGCCWRLGQRCCVCRRACCCRAARAGTHGRAKALRSGARSTVRGRAARPGPRRPAVRVGRRRFGGPLARGA